MAAILFFRTSVDKVLLLTLLLVACAAAHACGPGGSGSTCGSPGAPASASSASVNVGAGNPINVMSGNKYQREVDMPALPGVLGLEIVRHYNSTLSGTNTMPGIIGRGWKLSYETQLYAFDSTLQIMQADGTRLIFSRDLLNPSLCAGVDPANGKVDITGPRGNEQYVWTWNDGRRLSFDTRGKLTQIKVPTGEAVTLLYDAQGMLVKVTDPQGRELRLAYLDREASARGDRFRGVQSITTPVGRFSYEYGGTLPAGATLDKIYIAANLVKVLYPNTNGGRQYHYEDARRPTYLTGISVHDISDNGKQVVKRYSTYGYNLDGKAILSTHADDVNKVMLDYSVSGQTKLTNSVGATTVYRHAIIAGEFRLLEVRGPGCSLCGDSNVRYAYDKVGRLTDITQLDSDGRPQQSIRLSLDLYGRPLAVGKVVFQSGKAGSVQQQIRFEYGAGVHAGPTLIARPSVLPGKEFTTHIAYDAETGTLPSEVTQRGFVPAFDGSHVAQAIERSARYRYNAKGKRIETDGPLPNSKERPGPGNSDITLVDYDPRTQLAVRTTLPGNFSTEVLERDEALRPIRLRSNDGYTQHTVKLELNWRGQPLRVTVEGEPLTKGAPDKSSRLVRTWRYRYDSQGKLLEMTQPGMLHTGFEYDSAGRLTARVNPDGSRFLVKLDTENRREWEGSFTGPDLAPKNALKALRFKYDELGRLQFTKDDTDTLSQMEYTQQGQVASLTNAAGTEIKFTYDDNGLLLLRNDAVNTPDAASMRFAYNLQNRISAVDGPNHVVTQRRYDDFGRLILEANPDRGISLYMHDSAGHVVARMDDSGVGARYVYDQAGRLISVGSEKDDALIQYRYAGWRMVEMTAVDNTIDRRRLERVSYQYDTFGQITREQRWIAKVGHRSALGKGYKVALNESEGIYFITSNRYDDAGRLIWQKLPDGHTLEYCYSLTGTCADVKASRVRPGQLLAILFDGRALAQDIDRTTAGGLHTYTMGNGIRQRIETDARGRIIEVAAEGLIAETWPDRIKSWLGGKDDSQTKNIYRQINQYDRIDQLVHISRDRSTPSGKIESTVEQFEYDSQHRLEEWRNQKGNVIHFAYDKGGNRILETTKTDKNQETHGGNNIASRRYSILPGTNRLVLQSDSLDNMQQEHRSTGWLFHKTGIPLAQVAFDKKQQSSRRVVYNAAHRPIAIYDSDHRLVARYHYNTQGERIARTFYRNGDATGKEEGTTTYSLYRDQRLAAEADADGNITVHYVYLDGRPIAKIEMTFNEGIFNRLLTSVFGSIIHHPLNGDSQVYAIHSDHLGTPQIITDSQQRMVWQATTTPFGYADVTFAATDPQQNGGRPFEMKLRLPGQTYDAETGLHYNYYRDYDPQSGRYLTPDPLGIEGGINPYVYAGSNPVTNIDPLGLYQSDIHYYMNFFLGIAAGMDVEEARMLALAAQFVDDNDDTRPLNLSTGVSDAHRARLLSYHFTMVPSKVDPATGLVEGSVTSYGSPTSSTAYANIPENSQLQNLYSAVTIAGKSTNLKNSRCTQLVFMGEYLHSFEDTFAHRDANNHPFALSVGLGHGLYGSNPDYTYNHLSSIPGYGSFNWNHNEDRTLQMEREVFDKLVQWRAPGGAVRTFADIEDVLKSFNATPEHEGQGYDPKDPSGSEKIKFLQAELNQWGVKEVDWISPTGVKGGYDEIKAKANRDKFLCDDNGMKLDQKVYAGTILPSGCK